MTTSSTQFDSKKTLSHLRRMSGLSLIEILVTVVVLSIGLLGIAGMQAFGMRYSHDSYARSQGNLLANELIERMRANPDAVNNGDYKTAMDALDCSSANNDPAHPMNAAPSCTGTTAAQFCNVTQLAALDSFHIGCGQYLATPNALIGGVANLLPNGQIAISCADSSPGVAPECEGDNSRTVTITWQDPDAKGTAATLQVEVNAGIL
ncbi:MAG: type IV pilus modification protein PilV [Gammaproteobacteria bacterium]